MKKILRKCIEFYGLYVQLIFSLWLFGYGLLSLYSIYNSPVTCSGLDLSNCTYDNIYFIKAVISMIAGMVFAVVWFFYNYRNHDIERDFKPSIKPEDFVQ
jgi:hypothetical protein